MGEFSSRNILYVDAANLIMTCRDLKLHYDLRFLLKYLKDRHRLTKCVYFTARISSLNQDYELLLSLGVEVVFKKIYYEGDRAKANCDVQIANRVTADILGGEVDKVFLLSGDGDFATLLDYVIDRNKIAQVIGITNHKTSKLLKEKRKFNVTFIDEFLQRKGPVGHVASTGVLFDDISIPTPQNLSSLSQTKQKQASDILKQSGIVEILSKFGQVRVGGSFYTNLMTNNDIDIVVVSEDKYKSAKEFGEYLIENRVFQKFEFGDFNKFKREKRPEDFIVVVKYDYAGEKWEIEIWFKNELDKDVISLEEKLLGIDESKKFKILEEKYNRDKSSDKFKLSSYEIYKKYIE